MSNPDENEPIDTPPERTRASRLFRLVAAGMAGGIVTCLIAGLLVAMFLRTDSGDDVTSMGFFLAFYGGMYVMPFGFPLGFAVGLHLGDKKLNMHGRFWPAVAGSYAGMLLAVGVHLLSVPQHLRTQGIMGFVPPPRRRWTLLPALHGRRIGRLSPHPAP